MMAQLESAATVYLEKLAAGAVSADYTVEEYLAQNTSWLNYENGQVSITGLDDFVANYLGRMKACTAFDNLDCAEGENEEMDTASANAVHFNGAVAELNEQLKDRYPDEYAQYYAAYAAVSGDKALAHQPHELHWDR